VAVASVGRWGLVSSFTQPPFARTVRCCWAARLSLTSALRPSLCVVPCSWAADHTTSLRRPASLYCHIRQFSVASYHHPFWTTAGQRILSISALFLPATLRFWEETRHRRTEEDRLGDGGDDREDRLHDPVRDRRSVAGGDDGESLQGTGGISRVSSFLSATTPSLSTAVEGRAWPPLSCFGTVWS
jgi:hypothetical protein